MIEPKPLQAVKVFHTTFQHPILEKPQIPSADRCQLRLALLTEELAELQQAIDKKDLVEIADAFCDLQYVLSGAILEFGLQGKFYELFEEVQRSNMSKACKTEEEAKETQQYYYDKDKTESYYKEKDGLFLVYRKDDHKTLKSVNYSPANLQEILDK